MKGGPKDGQKNRREGVYAEAIVDRFAYTTTWVETGKTNIIKQNQKLFLTALNFNDIFSTGGNVTTTQTIPG